MDEYLLLGVRELQCPRAIETHRQHARNMKRVASGAVLDLMPAGSPVGDDQRCSVSAPHRRQQRKFGHLQRSLPGFGAIAENARHAAAARLHGFDLEVGNEPQYLLDRFERAK